MPNHTGCHLGCDRCTFGRIAPSSTISQLALSVASCASRLVILHLGSERSDASADFPTNNDEEIRECDIALSSCPRKDSRVGTISSLAETPKAKLVLAFISRSRDRLTQISLNLHLLLCPSRSPLIL